MFLGGCDFSLSVRVFFSAACGTRHNVQGGSKTSLDILNHGIYTGVLLELDC